ncbi:putative O-methyltransferase YrrM [Lutibacter sp. Hel_I_33_5]|uniref:O-methyltransferase n=1 Tax=Lutibacter sp. Hel_I_33_5 TaxID=1566289 RepID=UPI0011AAECF2|nr:class I SAM-dependent methyltransferase [Lutibacter sp. Hel_I_33_5]TVZ55182.1 putative O-methyltransferase YrrM [Lutibacter sp. Hel_I_33_5]
MFYQHIQYLKFLTKSTNQHGVHSPFVYNLVTLSLYKKTDAKTLNEHTLFKKGLLNNKNFINVTDFGSGSKIFKSEKRQVSKIAKIAGISNKKTQLLIKLITYFKPENVLEIGTSLGIGTTAIHLANPKNNIITLEGCPETSKVAKNQFEKFEYKNIDLITGDFSQTLPEVTKDKMFDCIYFDGNHTKKATLHYFNECIKTTNNYSFFIFDDIYWNSEMQEAWKEIKNHPKVTVTVDVFYFGVVFFRKEQAKEHFKVRVL